MNQRASYVNDFESFLVADPLAILGHLSKGQDGDVNPAQRDAWLRQIEILKVSIPAGTAGTICFEFVIPRIGKRADNVLLVGDQVVVIEFKVGSDVYEQSAKRQVTDYALDLRNFHLGSQSVAITPVLIATRAPMALAEPSVPYGGVYPARLANAASFRGVLAEIAGRTASTNATHAEWLQSGYRPTPTIIEASQALYRGHGVTEITHSEAGIENLGATTDALATVIDEARLRNEKVICFVTGVPGAGKTLAGLNLVYQRRHAETSDLEHAVFLSGNGPLVRVLQEALARDEVAQGRSGATKTSKSEAHRKAVTFIQNIHHFRDESLKDARPPIERVVVFDEAQRAWNRDQTSMFMRKKRGRPDFDASEPEFLIDVMDRHDGWAVVVCLVGGGQEINTGEAGLEEWLRALRDRFPAWNICLPAQLNSDYVQNFELDELGNRLTRIPTLHLSVSLRSFRSERLSDGIASLMSGDAERARRDLAPVVQKFPLVITRSLERAKTWVRGQARGSERFGLLASSGAKRLKPLGINMDTEIDPCLWFLNAETDVRSSYYLEDAASEFDVQGLELDWAIVAWDGDLLHGAAGWHFRSFKGTRWQEIRSIDGQRYRLNAYRVLLTRARQGMVIFVPYGDDNDPTRPSDYYDPTWSFLQSAGLRSLDELTG